MIGLFGGTFDPVHFGHLRPALEVLEALALEEVRFVPARVPPHRVVPAAAAEDRLRMLELALEGVRGFRVDRRELERDGPSYTVDTLRSLRGEVGDRPLVLIMGTDAFSGLAQWHRWTELIGLAHIAVACRPGATAPQTGPLAEWTTTRRVDAPSDLRGTPAGRMLFVEVTQLEIAATDIRARVARGASPRYLLPQDVADYIKARGLYCNAGDGAG
ncbi:MAG: nicotinate-nucleotide adenylyltransferase [Gammaproteobacteria bacterium]|nr:nicotinate-nucleotide adenylyltransferase [Gammaproteobacteria bacterium]